MPVVLSTDERACQRIDLTNEYVRAARDYGLSYAELKAIARAALVYSFLDCGAEARRSWRSSTAPRPNSSARPRRAQSLLGDFCLVIRYAVGWR